MSPRPERACPGNEVRETIEIDVGGGQGQRLNLALTEVPCGRVQQRDARDAEPGQDGPTHRDADPLHEWLCESAMDHV